MSSPFHKNAIKKRSGIFFYISLYFPWIAWNVMYRVFRKSLRQISMLPLIETIYNKWSRTIFEFNLIYLQSYRFSWVQCTCNWVFNGLVFIPTIEDMNHNYLCVSFNTLIFRRRPKIIHNTLIFFVI